MHGTSLEGSCPRGPRAHHLRHGLHLGCRAHLREIAGVHVTAAGYQGGTLRTRPTRRPHGAHRARRGRAGGLRPRRGRPRGAAQGVLGEPRPDHARPVGQRLRRVPGLGPDGNASTITTAGGCPRGRAGLGALPARPGRHRDRRHPGRRLLRCGVRVPLQHLVPACARPGCKGKVQLTYVTAEPFLGHFGIGGLPGGEKLLGMFLRKEGIDAVTGDGDGGGGGGRGRASPTARRSRSARAMVIPPFLGQEVVRSTLGPGRREGLRAGPRHLPVREVRRRLCRRRRRCRAGAVDVRRPGRRAQDRLPDRGAGQGGRPQHRRLGPR